MRLTYLATIRFPTEKAHGLAIAKMSEAFVNQGARIELVVPNRKQPPQLRGMPWWKLYEIKKRFPIRRLWCLDLLWTNWHLSSWFHSISYLVLAATFSFSLIHFLMTKKTKIIYTRDFFLAPLLLMLGKKVVAELHNWPKQSWLIKTYSFFGKRVSGLVVISKPLLVECQKAGIPDNKLLLAGSGVDADFFTRSNQRKAREILGLPRHQKIVLYSGSLNQDKGVEVLLKAATMAADRKDLLWLVVGGSFVEKEEEKIISRMRKIPSLKSFGFQEHDKIPLFLAAADVLVLPNSLKGKEALYKRYTSPMKLFEYLASGKPVIAAKIPALEGVVENKKQVLFFKPDDFQDLIRKTNLVLENKRLAERLADEGKRLVKDFTWEKRAEKVIGFINKQL